MLVARVGDITTGIYCHGLKCCCHGGPGINSKGFPAVLSEMSPVCCVGDTTIHSCPHCRTGMLLGASMTVWTGMKPECTIGQAVFEGCGMGIQVKAGNTVLNGI